MVEAAFTKGERFDMEYPVVGYHDGSIRWVRGIGTIQHYDGKDFFTGVLHDITERKQDEMRKNDFIGMVSHELKTPLTSLNAIIFDRYYRVESSNTRHISGFGIGLYLSAEIVQRHGGSIWLESEPGKGSTFYFTLPLNS